MSECVWVSTYTHRVCVYKVSPLLTLGLDGVCIDGGVGAACRAAGLQDVSADAAGNTRQLGGLQDECLPVLGQQLGAPPARRERGQALHLLAGHVTARSGLLRRGQKSQVTMLQYHDWSD